MTIKARNPAAVNQFGRDPGEQDSRGHLTFMAVNREIPKYLDATLWNRGFVDTNGKYYELWNAQAQYYTE